MTKPDRAHPSEETLPHGGLPGVSPDIERLVGEGPEPREGRSADFADMVGEWVFAGEEEQIGRYRRMTSPALEWLGFDDVLVPIVNLHPILKLAGCVLVLVIPAVTMKVQAKRRQQAKEGEPNARALSSDHQD